MVSTVLLGLLFAQKLGAPLDRAFAHNDYAHARPLYDALEHGFTYVEADVFLVDGKILVAHDRKDVKPEKNLEDLYLKPLSALAKNGRIYPSYEKPLWLMIDIKTDGENVYAALEKLLEGYKGMLCKWTDSGHSKGAVAIVLSGDRPVSKVAAQKERWVAIDGRPDDLAKNPPVGLVPWISTSFGDFKYPVSTEPSEETKRAVNDHIAKAHAQKRLVRFWSISDTSRWWKLQKDWGVDLINTDRLGPYKAWSTGGQRTSD